MSKQVWPGIEAQNHDPSTQETKTSDAKFNASQG